MDFSAKDLVKHFEKRLKENVKTRLPVDGKTLLDRMIPSNPMVVVYIGDEAFRAHKHIASSLCELWPPFRDELLFIGTRGYEEIREYVGFTTDADASEEVLTTDEIRGKITALLSPNTHFPNKTSICVYYIFDTTNVHISDEFQKALDSVEKIREELGIQWLDREEMQCVLLNDDLVHHDEAKAHRNILSSYSYKKGNSFQCDSVLLVSNRRSDGAILSNWIPVYSMIAAVIALSNNSNAIIGKEFFRNRVFTIGYAKEEKPITSIGQVIVKNFLQFLQDNEKMGEIDYGDRVIREKLGITSDGTLALLDQYVESLLEQHLPSSQDLNLFPRKDCNEHGDLSNFSAKAFNELTMGSWNCFFEELSRHITTDDTARKQWEAEYRTQIKKEFTANEQIALSVSINDFCKTLQSGEGIDEEKCSVLDYAIQKIRMLLSSDTKTIATFEDVLIKQGEEAKSYFGEKTNLIGSVAAMHDVKDVTIGVFYKKKLDDYVSVHKHNLVQKYESIQDMKELRSFLYSTLDDISNDYFFSLPFEKELDARLAAAGAGAVGAMHIVEKLTKHHTYLNLAGALKIPILSAILLQTGTDLHTTFQNNLPSATYYYNTGSNSKAEALIVYEVEDHNLIVG